MRNKTKVRNGWWMRMDEIRNETMMRMISNKCTIELTQFDNNNKYY